MNFEQLYAPSLKELFVQKLQGMILSDSGNPSSSANARTTYPASASALATAVWRRSPPMTAKTVLFIKGYLHFLYLRSRLFYVKPWLSVSYSVSIKFFNKNLHLGIVI